MDEIALARQIIQQLSAELGAARGEAAEWRARFNMAQQKLAEVTKGLEELRQPINPVEPVPPANDAEPAPTLQ